MYIKSQETYNGISNKGGDSEGETVVGFRHVLKVQLKGDPEIYMWDVGEGQEKSMT